MAQTDPSSHQAANRVYEDFEPSYEWAQDEESDTLILMLKGEIVFFSLTLLDLMLSSF